jgi:hypothetical protein
MKKIAIVIFLILFVGAAGVGGWAWLQNQKCKNQARDYLEQVQSIMAAWDDQVTLANSTGRGSLSPAIAAMQQTRRQVDALEYPACAERVQIALILSMESTIDSFIMFMAQEPDEDVQQKMTTASQAMLLAGQAIAEIQNEK